MNSATAAAAHTPTEAEALAARLDESVAFKVYSSADDYIRDAAAMLRRLSASPAPSGQGVSGEVRNVADALKQAFQTADPDATHRFDWADFGPYAPTDKGALVVAALIERLGLAEDYVEFADRRYQQGWEDARRAERREVRS